MMETVEQLLLKRLLSSKELGDTKQSVRYDDMIKGMACLFHLTLVSLLKLHRTKQSQAIIGQKLPIQTYRIIK